MCLCTLAVSIYVTSINVPIHFRALNEKLSIEKFKTLNRISVNAYGRSDDERMYPRTTLPLCSISNSGAEGKTDDGTYHFSYPFMIAD